MVNARNRPDSSSKSRSSFGSIAGNPLFWSSNGLVMAAFALASLGVIGWSILQITQASIDYINHT